MKPMLATFGIWELLIILLIVVVIFGASRLPGLGGALGKSIRNFRRSFRGEDETKEMPEDRRPELPPGAAAGSKRNGTD